MQITAVRRSSHDSTRSRATWRLAAVGLATALLVGVPAAAPAGSEVGSEVDPAQVSARDRWCC